MGETDGEQFSLRWNNFHNNLTAGFHALLQEEDLVDVTLAAGGQFVHAHKIVLSVCSPYFKELFKVNPCKHPIVILKDVGHKELVAILQFMYQGEVNVQQEDLATFLKTAELLQIKGLTENDSPATNTPPSVPDTSETTPASRTTQPSLPEPPVVQSEDTPVHPYKRMRSETPAPSSTSVSSPCTVNEDTGGVEIVEMSKPKIEPVDYESDLEEVGRLPSHDDPLAQLLGGESSSHSHQDSAQGTVPIFASIPGLSQDSGSSQDGGQVMYAVTKRGQRKLLLDGYMYTKHQERQYHVVWRCCERNTCSARICQRSIPPHKIIKRGQHSHPPDWTRFYHCYAESH
ncbi:broad-complex core protein isoforms 1/2/3/4/5-like isoform X7 [Zootermopsis nevadensis]|uniref:broad-complex core protein isoforms 1/2/3/4/5-like isoform X7 n=1 Tax=Zootermopsis nevadensis TaxID=136037 RepID=UPI000B8E9472|nr:broad-complex core protein isoforms 1/2/3/4/5-like isoform X7 [Zootermopsis nevadensis]